MSSFGDNMARLIGMHRLTASRTAKLLGIDQATMSMWLNDKRLPSLHLALRVSKLFEVSPDRMMTASFSSLLHEELGDVERFQRVEVRIKRQSTQLRAV